MTGALRLCVEGLIVDRAERRVLDGSGFIVEGGEALLVTGPNGAGKSTLLRALAGLTQSAAGTIALDGFDGPLGDALHFVGHLNAIKLQLTAYDNLAFWLRWLDQDAALDPSVDDALAALRLERLADSPAEFLSQGQRRRLALARLVVTHRPVWLLDEPTAGLDAAARSLLRDVAHGHLSQGGIIVAATHDALGLEGRSLELAP